MFWYETWMDIAKIIAKRSKDPNTQVGCVLVSPDNRHMALGFNGFAAGIEETKERWSRPTKYEFVIHAEENAIINSKTDLAGWTCYCTLKPCQRCASKIVQAGITQVIYLDDNTDSAQYDITDAILEEGGVDLIRYGELA